MKKALDSVSITGFKSIRALEQFELNKLNILIGANGAGKSNFVSFFRMLRAMSEERLSIFVTESGGADGFFLGGPKETPQIEAHLKFGQNGWKHSRWVNSGRRIFLTEALPVSRVLMLVEGQTERAIADQVFAPALAVKGVYLYPRIVGKPGHKGGNKFSTVRRELKALIHQEPQSTVTTFFDYFRLFKDWPGLAEAKGKKPDEVPGIIEPAVAKAVASVSKKSAGSVLTSTNG